MTLRLPQFLSSRHINVVRMSALSSGRLYSPGGTPRTFLYYRLGRLQGHSAAGRIESMKSKNDHIGNRTRELPALNAVP